MKLIKNWLGPKSLLFIALTFTAFITVGSLISSTSIPDLHFQVSDKLIHSVSYFILVVLWFLFFFSITTDNKFYKILTICSIAAFIYGILIEVLQGKLIETRTADVLDVFANGLGILVAIMLLHFFQRKLIHLKNEN